MSEDQNTSLPRMRTLDECFRELKEIDPKTAISKNFIRRLALSGTIPTVMAGNKRLINLDGLILYLNNPKNNDHIEKGKNVIKGVRRIS